MIKRGWLDGVTDVRDLPGVEKSLCKFFNAASIEEIKMFSHSSKKTNAGESVTPVQEAWLFRVKQIADDMLVGHYTPSAVRGAVGQLKLLLAAPESARKVPRILAECGIRYAIVESLPGAKIDGVCFWLDNSSPVIGMSMRYDRIDNFWFVLRHELEHVLQCHGQQEEILDASLEGEQAGVGPNVSEEERIANDAAANFCVPRSALKDFIDRKAPFFAERDIIGFAHSQKVHPGLVAGQLQRHLDRYDRFRSHLVKLRSLVAPNAMVDGWGNIARVGEQGVAID